MLPKAKKEYSLSVTLTDDDKLYLIKLIKGTSKRNRKNLFQFVSREIPRVKHVIELYRYHELWHDASLVN